MYFDTSLMLPDSQYYKEQTKKDLIVMHHTVGGTAKSTVEYWLSTPDHIATAFVIERDGTVYQMFDPMYWAHHVGAKDPRNLALNKRSIGIELASEGGLTKVNDKLYCYGIVSQRTEFKQPFVDLGCVWRGYQYFDAYSDEQIESTIVLINFLCTEFNIPKTVFSTTPYDYKTSNLDLSGICGHSHLRADKSDVHPLFPWDKL